MISLRMTVLCSMSSCSFRMRTMPIFAHGIAFIARIFSYTCRASLNWSLSM
ncbi:hypothetical protein D3C78_1769210 [compost metagenome]